ncbi:MAG: hypothetical protein LC799_15595, partial [Actinobacteria bacterium]|nr:hypothetical protein [Actinomycetota bacterium]
MKDTFVGGAYYAYWPGSAVGLAERLADPSDPVVEVFHRRSVVAQRVRQLGMVCTVLGAAGAVG